MNAPHRQPRGFTLVEVLLSLSLLMLVLATAYAGMELLRRATTAGRADAARAQLARALEMKIAGDLRGVVYTPPDPADTTTADGSTAGGIAQTTAGQGAADDTAGVTAGSGGSGTSSTNSSSSSSSSSSTTSTAEVTAPTDAYTAAAAGLFGDATTLVIHVSRPMRMLVATPPVAGSNTPAAAAGGDLRSVSYFLGGSGTAIASGLAAPDGLARRDGERRAIEQATASGNDALLAAQTSLLAPEVKTLQFRYFDGFGWLAAWDTAAMGKLPRAIEVTLGIAVADAERPKAAGLRNAAQEVLAQTRTHRFVVFLPLAETPPVEEGL